VRVRIEDSGDWRPGVANFGRTPTTGIRDPLLETFLFDFDGDLYGRWIEVALVAYLRPELTFTGVEEMVDQMHLDCDAARARLGRTRAG
jgi:riboflavin kinase/FMN adenylyltransferase